MGEWTHSFKVGAELQAERIRQISAEGWDAGHDDEHEAGELALAAACYALSAGEDAAEHYAAQSIPKTCTSHVQPTIWPWSEEWWKPKDARRNLVRAGALIIAEIERIDRAQHPRRGKGERR